MPKPLKMLVYANLCYYKKCGGIIIIFLYYRKHEIVAYASIVNLFAVAKGPSTQYACAGSR